MSSYRKSQSLLEALRTLLQAELAQESCWLGLPIDIELENTHEARSRVLLVEEGKEELVAGNHTYAVNISARCEISLQGIDDAGDAMAAGDALLAACRRLARSVKYHCFGACLIYRVLFEVARFRAEESSLVYEVPLKAYVQF